MKSFKKALKLLGLIALIFLGSIGVGLGGAAPAPSSKRNENILEIHTEQVDLKEEKESNKSTESLKI